MSRFLVINLFIFLIISSNSKAYFVPFIEAMKPNRDFKASLIQTDPRWRAVNDLYNRHIMQSKNDYKTIPDIIHQVWVSKPLPKDCELLRASLIAGHPSWKFVFWTDNDENLKFGTIVVHSFQELVKAIESDEQFIVVDVRKVTFLNQDALNAAKNPGEQSDIIRYEALYEVGGIYLDTDFECLRSFEELNQRCDFYAGVSFTNKVVLLNGLIGTIPRNPILKYCIKNLKKAHGPTNADDIMRRTGEGVLTRAFFHVVNEGIPIRAIALPSTYFYSWPNWRRHDKSREHIESWIKPESIVLHHWHVSWVSQLGR